MSKKYQKSLFIFRRDLRLVDNTALLEATSQSQEVILCFIFDPRQVTQKNEFKSDYAIQCMLESLTDLETQVKKINGHINFCYGEADSVVNQVIIDAKIDAVYCNQDYTPFSLERDETIAQVCRSHKIDFIQAQDLLLTNPDKIKTKNNDPYSVFTAFYKRAIKDFPVSKPNFSIFNNISKKKLNEDKGRLIFTKILTSTNNEIYKHAGRTNGSKILKKIKKFENYSKTHDFPAYDTTLLSSHLKFGTISIREAYYTISKELSLTHPLIRQLYWHDFFTYVAYHSPFVFGQPYKEKYKNLAWHDNNEKFIQWCKGKTGFPIVDAGMRQLNQTGFMHNRVRMITASFLTKDLHINWLLGEKYFAQKLVDYDPCVNNGNWQWVASTGCDAQPYFRIFNPWLQQQKFDPNCIYIKRWIPELKNIDPKIIHTWYKKHQGIKIDYPHPCVDHTKERKIALEMYNIENRERI